MNGKRRTKTKPPNFTLVATPNGEFLNFAILASNGAIDRVYIAETPEGQYF